MGANTTGAGVAAEPWHWVRRRGLRLLEARLGPASLFFTSRVGGVSAAPFDTLNLGAGLGDRDDDVAENRRRLLAALDLSEGQVRHTRQVHGTAVVVAGTVPWTEPPAADGLVTSEPGLALLLRYADCVPVFLAAPGPRPTAALAHAGWRGLADGVVGAAVATLCREAGAGPGAVLAAIGPAIGTSYRVDEPVMARMRARHAWADALQADDGVFDMTGAVRRALDDAGVAAGQIVETSERTESPAFFSHRASGGRTGRMAAVIRLDGRGHGNEGNAFRLANTPALRDWEGLE